MAQIVTPPAGCHLCVVRDPRLALNVVYVEAPGHLPLRLVDVFSDRNVASYGLERLIDWAEIQHKNPELWEVR